MLKKSLKLFTILMIVGLLFTGAVAAGDGTDTIAPVLVEVTPAVGEVNLAHDKNFVLTVKASDDNLRELEVDHSLETILPEFSVYASADNPYGTEALKEEFINEGLSVEFNEDTQTWTIDFGETVTDTFAEKGITFYLVVKDKAGNKFGSMDPTTEVNTFAYTVTKEEAPTPPSIEDFKNLKVTVTERAKDKKNPTDKGGVRVSLGWKALLDEEYANKPAWDVLESLDITLFKGEKELVKNSLTDRYEGTLGNATPSPFNYGTEGNTQWSWDRGAYPLVDYQLVKPDKVVVAIKVKGSDEVVQIETTNFTLPVDDEQPVLGDVTLTNDDEGNLVLTVKATDNVGLATLEVDHSLEGTLPEFTVGTEYVSEDVYGASSTFDVETGTWTLNFGKLASDTIREETNSMTFYFVITDVNGKEFGSMDPTTPENTRTFAVPAAPTYTVTFKETNDVSLDEATIVVKGEDEVEVTDLTEVKNGDYTYTINLAGYEELTGEFTVEGAAKEVEVTLELYGKFGINTAVNKDWTPKHPMIGYLVDVRVPHGDSLANSTIVVTLMNGDEVLQKNTATGHGFTRHAASVPFDVYGGYDYLVPSLSDKTVWNIEGGIKDNPTLPTSVVIELTLENGKYLTETLENPFTQIEPRFTLTLPESTEEGSITATIGEDDDIVNDGDLVIEGTEVTLTVEPDAEYKLKSLVVKGTDEVDVTEVDGTFTFTMPAEAVTVTAEFEKITYAITIDEIANGTVAADVTEAAEGDTVTLTVTPDTGFKLATLTGATFSPEVSADVTEYTFVMGAADVTIGATFEETEPDVEGYEVIIVIDSDKPEIAEVETNLDNHEAVEPGTEVVLTVEINDENYLLKKLIVKIADVEEEEEVEVTPVEEEGKFIFKMPEAPVKVIAVLEIQKATVTYDLDGGTGADAPTAAEYEIFTNIIVKPLPQGITNGEAVFVGWEDIKSTKLYLPGDVYRIGRTDSVTLKAVWSGETAPVDPVDPETPVQFVVSYVSGDNVMRFTVEEGTELEFPEEIFYKQGYKFTGWEIDGVAAEEGMIVESDLTLEAAYTELPILVEGNEKATLVDVIVLMQYNAKTGAVADMTETEMVEAGFDFNGDGAIDLIDVLMFLRSI